MKNGYIPQRAREKLKIPDNIIIKATKSGYINETLLSEYILFNSERTLSLLFQILAQLTKLRKSLRIFMK